MVKTLKNEHKLTNKPKSNAHDWRDFTATVYRKIEISFFLLNEKWQKNLMRMIYQEI